MIAMKTVLRTILILVGICFATEGFTQDSKQDTPFVKKVGKAVKKAGDETAKVAVKGASAVADKIYEGKTGPDGQTIYIDKHSRYYYVGERGKKIYISKARLLDKIEK
jgi:hypothetical protein